jgi:hypothetical protein
MAVLMMSLHHGPVALLLFMKSLHLMQMTLVHFILLH